MSTTLYIVISVAEAVLLVVVLASHSFASASGWPRSPPIS